MANADLITLAELKSAMQITETETAKDTKMLKAIAAASAAIRRYCDRSFGEIPHTAVKAYDFDSSGYLDIDDAVKVLQLTLVLSGFTNFRQVLDPAYWHVEPQEGPPYTYVRIPKWYGLYSPEMGFRQNMDVYAREKGWPWYFPLVEVEAEWGWPEVPEDVRQAAIWTAARFQEKPDALISESIANYSYTTRLRGEAGLANIAIPQEAQDLLSPYVRFEI